MKLRDFLVATATIAFAACGTPYRATDTTVIAPANVQTAFTTQYPTAVNIVWANYDQATAIPIDWELAGWTVLDERDYLVRFNMDNTDYYAWYDEDGTWIGTTYIIRDFTTIPAPVTSTINTQFAGYTITGINREFHKDRVAYEVELKSGDNRVKMLVDPNGNIIKQKTKY